MPSVKGRNPRSGSFVVNVSSATIVKTIALIALALLLLFLRDIVAMVLVALLLAALIDPIIHWASRFHIPRILSIITIYLGLGLITALVLVLAAPTILSQSKQLLTTYAPLIEEATGNQVRVQELLAADFFTFDAVGLVQNVQDAGLAEAMPQLLQLLTGLFGGLLQVIFVFVLGFYMVVEESSLRNAVTWLTPPSYRSLADRLIREVRSGLGAWLRGQIVLMILIFFVTYAVLSLLGVPYALLLATIAGFLEIIPFLGPTISAVPAVVVALTISPVQGLFVALAYLVIQQLEGNILAPKVMQKVAGVNPVVSIIALLVGFEIAGVAGAVLAIPFAVMIGIATQELRDASPKGIQTLRTSKKL